MQLWTHRRRRFPLPAHHRFPLEKYELLAERVVADGLTSTSPRAPATGATRARSTRRSSSRSPAPVRVVLAGGYAEDIRDTVDINAATAAAVGTFVHGPRADARRFTHYS